MSLIRAFCRTIMNRPFAQRTLKRAAFGFDAQPAATLEATVSLPLGAFIADRQSLGILLRRNRFHVIRDEIRHRLRKTPQLLTERRSRSRIQIFWRGQWPRFGTRYVAIRATATHFSAYQILIRMDFLMLAVVAIWAIDIHAVFTFGQITHDTPPYSGTKAFDVEGLRSAAGKSTLRSFALSWGKSRRARNRTDSRDWLID